MQLWVAEAHILHDRRELWRLLCELFLALECLIVKHRHAMANKVDLCCLGRTLNLRLNRPAELLNLSLKLSHSFNHRLRTSSFSFKNL